MKDSSRYKRYKTFVVNTNIIRSVVDIKHSNSYFFSAECAIGMGLTALKHYGTLAIRCKL